MVLKWGNFHYHTIDDEFSAKILRRCQDRFDIICQRWTLTNDLLLSQILIDILNVADLLFSINRNYTAAKQTMMRYQRWKLESKQTFSRFSHL